MANFDSTAFKDPAVAHPTSGLHVVDVRYVNGSTVITSSDKLRLIRIPKNCKILAELCSFWSDDVDPDSGANLTMGMFATDGTTTKTIIAAQAFQAINVRVEASAATISALAFFKTLNDDYYVYLQPGAGDLDASAEVYARLVYTMDTSGRYENT
jgi:hypothetical protein